VATQPTHSRNGEQILRGIDVVNQGDAVTAREPVEITLSIPSGTNAPRLVVVVSVLLSSTGVSKSKPLDHVPGVLVSNAGIM
jgi:hypothetical protein